MDTNYTIKLIKSANDKDLVEALDIYIKMVDEHQKHILHKYGITYIINIMMLENCFIMFCMLMIK